jgi:hypothetical protein
MMNGLIESMKSDPAPGQSLSSRALIRGVEISNAVSDIEKNDPSGVAFSVQVLQGYYEFLLRKVRLLDPEASHLNFSRTREPLSIITIEKNAEKYVLETPKWLMSFTEKTHEMYLPKPSARIFLKMAELISTYALEDFSNSLMKHKYDCVEIRLKNLKEKIVKYNLGSRTFSNDKVAVNVVATALDSIIKQMNSGCESEFNSRKE